MSRIDNIMLSDIISEIVDVYGLNSACKKILEKNILKRVELYAGVSPILTSETRIIKNPEDTIGFFLNRLINNIRKYNIETELNLDGGKGEYIDTYQQLNMHSFESIKRVTRDKMSSRISAIDDKTLNLATAKVFDHEVGHALQTSFEGTIGVDDRNFKNLLDRLNKKYPSIFNSYDDLVPENLSIQKKGMKVTRKNDKYAKARAFYAPNAYSTHLDEIFNEEEALAVTNVLNPQMEYNYGDDFSRPIYNYESSNYRITPYATMMKILLGNKRTFHSMYIDSISTYVYFDEFLSESSEVFKDNKPPMINILKALESIKSGKNMSEVASQSLKLDLFFAKCLETKINKVISSQTLSGDQIDVLLSKVDMFQEQLIKSSKKLKTSTIISGLKKKLNNLKGYKPNDLLNELDRDDLNNNKQNIQSLLNELNESEPTQESTPVLDSSLNEKKL